MEATGVKTGDETARAAAANALLSRYERTEVIGEGAYGVVYKGIRHRDQSTVAIKKIRLYEGDVEERGVPKAVIREVGLLRELNHNNVVKLLDVIHIEKRLMLVFEFVQEDLKTYLDRQQVNGAKTLISQRVGIGLSKVKSILHQILLGVAYCHLNRVLHRDLKPHNILVTDDGRVKLADFGLARLYSASAVTPPRPYTHEVVTLWYRSPELLLGAEAYGPEVDVWSVGCMFSEIFTGLPLFPGQSEIDQMFKIFRVLGTPSDDVWEDVTRLAHYQHVFPRFPKLARDRLASESMPPAGLELLELMLACDPRGRASCQAALGHEFLEGAKGPAQPQAQPILRTVSTSPAFES
ncbi:hypothetical protein TeGR_g13468 [Tetraparma gracilis]|uniref:Cyclin-dependent kinase 2 homolog n=1 Tax=Tetraparma gracilis TaxID=2962635 RepID=A0ABQ6N0D7_9STRA|nr:hypothetical protein TeGR_g13468 [Tetraparma gracilis]